MGALAIALLASVSVAQACQGPTVLFQDDFSSLEPTWGSASNEVGVADHHMVLKPEANFTLWVPNTASLYDDVDVCADFTSVAAVDADHSYAGLIFWYVDDDNFYAFEYAANGNASAWRRQRGRWLKQVDWQGVPSLKPNDGATNQLRVVTAGTKATFYVNGNEFSSIKGALPSNGQQVGLIASSPQNAVATYSIANFKVTEPAK